MRLKISLLLGFIFFLLALVTLPHYGINWDTINHLPRGQSYLRYYLTGKKDYSELPDFELYWQDTNTLFFRPIGSRVARVSMYQQASGVDFNYFMEHDGGGHSPLSDILSSYFNYVLFQKLGVVNDIDSYRIYGVFLASVLVGVLYWWVSKAYGGFAGLVAAISLATYPLFWAESHFNTEKDIPETVYWSLLLFSVWKGVRERSKKWLLLSGVFFGLALGTKFNVLFSVFVIVPWLLFVWVCEYFEGSSKKKLVSFVKDRVWILKYGALAVAAGIVIFFVGWPYLWPDPIARVGTVLSFYREIGTTSSYDPRFLGPWGINTYPSVWIAYTTPPVTLLLFCIGALAMLYKVLRRGHVDSVLFLLWLVVPIARATWPGATTYGGVRQLMEYIPALAVVAGVGALWLRDRIVVQGIAGKNLVSIVIFLFALIPITIRLYEIHPNENVYFNFLIGGLDGARAQDIPNWGMNFGAAYREGVDWLNNNTEDGARVAFAHELLPNIPRIWFRSGVVLFNTYRSGYLAEGEYAITLTYRGTSSRSYYDMYLEKFVNPVYVVEVDGVPILKIWKNSAEYFKVDYDEKVDDRVDYEVLETGLRFDLGEVRKISRLEIKYDDKDCEGLSVGYTSISENGTDWVRLPEVLPNDWRIAVLREQPKDGRFIEPFVGQEARFIDFNLQPVDTCLKNVESFELYYFE